MNHYDILQLADQKQRSSINNSKAELEGLLFQCLIEKNVCNQIVIQKYLRSISKTEKKIRKNGSEGELNDSHSTPIKREELSNDGFCYYSQQKIIVHKEQHTKIVDNPEIKWISNSVSKNRQPKQYKRVRNTVNNKAFRKPIEAAPLSVFFVMATPTQSEPSGCEKKVSKKENLANELRKLLLKEVYTMHQNIYKNNEAENGIQEQRKLSSGQQSLWPNKHLNIKKIGIPQSNQSRKIKTESTETTKEQSSQFRRRLQQSDINQRRSDIKQRQSDVKERIEQAQKLLPKVSGPHLQRNKRCLQMFLKFTSHKKNMNVFRSMKTQVEEVNELKKCRINTVPLKKES